VITALARAAALASVLLWTSQSATSAKVWLGHEREIEQHLKAAQVMRIEDIGTGVTNPKRAHLMPAQPFESLVWKVLPPGVQGGYFESYKSEIAGYELDKLLRLRMVPPAVERRIGNDTGAAIMWLDGVKSVKDSGGQVPSGPAWDKPIRRMIMFYNLIGNRDRNGGNILIGRPGDLILIDHSRAFVSERDLPRKMERVDAEMWDRITAVTAADLTRTLSPWMDSRAVDAVLQRRTRMMSDVQALVAKRGRSLVIIRQ
jgi:hypothetical protein